MMHDSPILLTTSSLLFFMCSGKEEYLKKNEREYFLCYPEATARNDLSMEQHHEVIHNKSHLMTKYHILLNSLSFIVFEEPYRLDCQRRFSKKWLGL
jgi:hypothetical protein